MPYPLNDKLVVGITSRALFDLAEEDGVFRRDGLAAYRTLQRSLEAVPLEPGTAFPLVRGLLRINDCGRRLIEVIVISQNDADSGMRIMNSIEHHGLDISRGAFTNGRDAAPYLPAFHCGLFLSAERADIEHATQLGFPAALICPRPGEMTDQTADVLCIAFDGDAVLFDGESEAFFKKYGLDAFLEREAALADSPMNPGPFAPFLLALRDIQQKFPADKTPIRTALVTARNAPAHKRVVNTLRQWGVRIDETFFLGGIEKASVLEVLRPHIYFDDQLTHLETAQLRTPSAQVISIAVSGGVADRAGDLGLAEPAKSAELPLGDVPPFPQLSPAQLTLMQVSKERSEFDSQVADTVRSLMGDRHVSTVIVNAVATRLATRQRRRDGVAAYWYAPPLVSDVRDVLDAVLQEQRTSEPGVADD